MMVLLTEELGDMIPNVGDCRIGRHYCMVEGFVAVMTDYNSRWLPCSTKVML